jgi:hypothetical protein
MTDVSFDNNGRTGTNIAVLPESEHGKGLCRGRQPDSRPTRLEAVIWAPPVFVVGCPRSGTTLVQTMLDSHPHMCVTYEADFLVDIPLGLRSSRANSAQALRSAVAHPNFRTPNCDVALAHAVCRELGIMDSPGAMRVLAASQALAQGKTRWGNKTPKALLHLAELAVVYPDAQFIHVIRDGREAASSQMRVSDRSLVQGALLWRTGLRTGRRAGSRLGRERYLEVRLEEVLASPEAQLRRMCAFLGEDFAPSMLQSHTVARQRIPASDLGIHPRLGEPPQPVSSGRKDAAPKLVQRAAAALMDTELVKLGYAPASSGRGRRTFHIIVGYALFTVSLRRSLPDLFRYLARSHGARRAARRGGYQPGGPHSQGDIMPHQSAISAPIEAAGTP